MNDKIYLTHQEDTLRYRAIAQRILADHDPLWIYEHERDNIMSSGLFHFG